LSLSNKEVVGRNDPCPCGSGKKYKYCCLAIPMKKRSDLVLQKSYDDDDSVFSPSAAIEYGRADLNSPIIDSRHLHEISSPRMLYSVLLMPQAEALASRISNQLLTRARGEAARIARARTLQQLLEIMAHRPDPLNNPASWRESWSSEGMRFGRYFNDSVYSRTLPSWSSVFACSSSRE